jgi:dUTP pyrophosphatase
MKSKVKFVKTEKSTPVEWVPSKDPDDAGYDLKAVEEITIPPMERRLIKTGLKMAINRGEYGRIAPRSGLAYKKGIMVMAGVIDSGFRGEVGVILYNSQQGPAAQLNFEAALFNNFSPSVQSGAVTIKPGDRIAQLIIEECKDREFVEVDSLDDTERGNGGFGSTGE